MDRGSPPGSPKAPQRAQLGYAAAKLGKKNFLVIAPIFSTLASILHLRKAEQG
jgi:hypothetical protein